MRSTMTALLVRRALLVGMLVALGACSTQQIRKDAMSQLQAGHYEESIATIRDGLHRHPDSSELLATLRRVQDQAVSSLLASASDKRAAKNWEGAQADVDRAASLAPTDQRVRLARATLDLDRRSATALAGAGEMIEKGKSDEAATILRRVAEEDPQNPDLRALQRRMADARHQTIATSPHLPETKPISLDFRDAPVRQVFEALSRETHVNFVIDKDVRPDQHLTVFVRDARLEHALDLILDTNQLAKKVLDESTVVIYPSTPEKKREYQDLIIKSVFLAHAEAKQAAAMLRSVLKIAEPYVDERMNLLILRDSADNIEAAQRLLTILDQGEPEVMIEVEVLEVNSMRLTELGIQLPNSFSLTILPPGTSSQLTLRNIKGLNPNRVGVDIGSATVNLNRQLSDANVLANPRIRAKNREKAQILIGDKYPIVSASAAPNAGFVSDTITYIDVGIKLEFQPIVGLDGDVTLKLNLEVSSLANQIKTSSGTIAYQIGTRSAGTTLRLQDGETQILGGLISRNDSTSSNRLPGFGDIPLLGRLLSSQSDNAQRTEVLLSITPHVIDNLQRPGASLGEFYSGTESALRLRAPDSVRSLAPGASEVTRPAGAAVAAFADAQPAGRESVAATADFARTDGPAHHRTADVAAPPPSPGGFAVAVSGPELVKLDGDVDIVLAANASKPLRALPITITYDPTHLKFKEFVRGDLLGEERETTVSYSVDAPAGRIVLGIVRNGEGAISGGGVLGDVRFSAIALGETETSLAAVTPMGATQAVPAPDLPPPVHVRIQ